jgi:hypothetical protein
VSDHNLRRALWILALMAGLASPCWAKHQQSSANSPNPPPPPAQTAPPASQSSIADQNRAADAAALADLAKAKQALEDLTNQQWTAFQQTPDWTAAQTNLSGAKSNLDDTRKTASDSLASNPDYQAALAAKQKAAEDIANLRASGDATPDTMLPLANAELQANSKIRQMESDLIARDPAVQAASDKVTAAQHDLDVLKVKFQNDLAADRQYAAARAAVDLAQTRYDDAHAKLASNADN